MIELKAIVKTYRAQDGGTETPVLRGVTLSVARGEMVALTGTSGSGKSTLLNVIGGLDRDFSGALRVDGQDLRALSDNALSAFRNRTVGFIFQQFHLLPHLPVLANVALPRWFDRRHDRQSFEADALAALDAVGLKHKAASRPNHLSGGEKQRIAIARALFNNPSVLLCDEPTGALDSENTTRVFDLIEKLNKARGLTVIVVTHEPDIAARCPRQVHLRDGVIVEDTGGSPAPVAAVTAVAEVSHAV